MMFIWLGSLALLLFGWDLLWQSFRELTATLHKTLLEKKSPQTIYLFSRVLSLNLSTASARANVQDGILCWNLGLKKRRESVLRLCLSSLGWFLPLIMATFYLGISGYFILGLAFFGFFNIVQAKTSKAVWRALFGLGLFLGAAEISLRQAPVLLSSLGTSDLTFFLADGRFGAVCAWVVLGLVLSLLISIEMWSLVVALSLLVINVISLNGALGLVLGELLALPLLMSWRTRNISSTQKKTVLFFSLSSILGSLLGFWFAGELRSVLGLGFSDAFSAYQGRILQILLLVSVILITQTVVLMILGHFLSKETAADGVEGAIYLDRSWKADLSPVLKDWLDARIAQRLNEIRYHIQGLNSLPPGKIPVPVQNRLLREEKQLSDFVQSSEGQ